MDNTENNGVVNNDEVTETVEDTAAKNTETVEDTAAKNTEAIEETVTPEPEVVEDTTDAVEAEEVVVEEVVVENVNVDPKTQEQQPKHNFAVAALVLGIVSIVGTFCCCSAIGLILGIVGTILAIMAKKEGNTETILTAGLVLSIIGIALGFIFTIITIIGFIISVANGNSYGTTGFSFYRFFRMLGLRF